MFDPRDAKRLVGGAYYARNFGRDCAVSNLGKGIGLPSVIVEDGFGMACDLVVGVEPRLPHDNGVDRKRPGILNEAGQEIANLGIARLVFGKGWRDRIRGTGAIYLHDVWRHDRARAGAD